MSDYPKTADEFMKLPVGEATDDAQAFFVPDDLVVSVISRDERWLLHQRPNGEWFRIRQ